MLSTSEYLRHDQVITTTRDQTECFTTATTMLCYSQWLWWSLSAVDRISMREFVATLGAHLRLFLGMSLFSLVELIIIAVHQCVVCCASCSCRACWRQAKTKSPPPQPMIEIASISK